MNEQQAKNLAHQFLEAITTEQVDTVIDSDSAFSCPENWKPYGGRAKNWDTIGSQTSEPVGAFAELLINSIDAILMRKAKENDEDGTREDSPRSMIEAVNRFFDGVLEGKIASLSPRQRTELADKSVIVGIKRLQKRHKYPTYTIADFGEGQNADKFGETLVSLGQTNKERIPFVQGKFNMGSTGCITFCTCADILKGQYKFILSKRTLPDSDGAWGWTLVRTRKVREGEELPVVEYFCPNEKIPRFLQDSIQSLKREDIGVIDGGTIVKLYEYDIGPAARTVDFGLRDALITSLIHCALPIRIYDFNAAPDQKRTDLRSEGIWGRTFSGMSVDVSKESIADTNSDENIDLPRYLVSEDKTNPELGGIKIFATGFKKLRDSLQEKKYAYRIFYTINGQTQAKERASFFRKAKIDALRNHLLVEVDCDAMDKTARSAVFKSDRERMSDIELTRSLKKIVVDSLGNDKKLREYETEIRKRRAGEQIKNTIEDKKFWNELTKQSPELQELFGVGDVIMGKGAGRNNSEKFEGNKFPTYLKLYKPSNGILHLPVNTYRKIICETDVVDDYFGRELSPGEFVSSFSQEECPRSEKLRNGRLTITVHPSKNAAVGDNIKGTFGFSDADHPLPLNVEIKIVFAREEEKINKPTGETIGKVGKTPIQKFPDIIMVEEDKWDEYDFDEMSGARVAESNEETTIFVNRDNKYLKVHLENEVREDRRDLAIHRFKYGVSILTLAMHKKFKDKYDNESGNDNWDDYVRFASASISAHVVTLITKLGENP